MSREHFDKLLECLQWEAEAEAQEVLRTAKWNVGDQAERGGHCLVGLAIRDEAAGFGGRTLLTLGKRDRRQNLPWTRLNCGTPIVLFEEQVLTPELLRGVITQRDRETICVAVSDAPDPKSERPLFRLELSSDEIARDRQRDAIKRVRSAEQGRLAAIRNVLLGEGEPTFEKAVDWQPLTPLDASQTAAVAHALTARDVAIIHGPPGTGKTTAVVELIRQSIRRGERVLACAASNLAVDNLLQRLLYHREKALRVGHPARVLPELRDHTLDELVETHPDLKLAREWTKEAWSLRRQASRYTRTAPPPGQRRELREQAQQLLNDARQIESRLVDYLIDSASVVCATLTGLDRNWLGDRRFDLVVIDEAAQATEPPCWIPLLRSQKIVLAGDHLQLPATVVSSEAQRAGLQVSLMERLVSRWGHLISRQLTTQYRMNEQIMRFSSDEFYESTLIAADRVRTHRLSDIPAVTSCSLTETVLKFYDTAGSNCQENQEAEGASKENAGEAEYVARHVKELLTANVSPDEIAVITPYAAQARRLRELIPEMRVEVDTVDGFQGREKDAVVISLVRSNTKGELGFVSDIRRMNVAMTRARRQLVIFGDSSTLGYHPFFQKLLEFFELYDAYGTVWELDATFD